MQNEEEKIIAVIGAGQMGSGIAQTLATYHLQVLLIDVSDIALQKAASSITASLKKLEQKELLSDSIDNISSRLLYSSKFEDISADCELVIEAVSENIELKTTIFKKLDEICSTNTILASNTSAISITQLAALVSEPHRFIGMHFMNPVPLMPLVEIIKGVQTSSDTFNHIYQLTEDIKKTPVEVNDNFGFVSNRVLMPMINEAAFCLYEGVATSQDIDKVMTLGMRHPMGPLALADLIGLDTCLSIMEVLYEGFADTKYRPCPLLKQYVAAGRTGKKSGHGFYQYD